MILHSLMMMVMVMMRRMWYVIWHDHHVTGHYMIWYDSTSHEIYIMTWYDISWNDMHDMAWHDIIWLRWIMMVVLLCFTIIWWWNHFRPGNRRPWQGIVEECGDFLKWFEMMMSWVHCPPLRVWIYLIYCRTYVLFVTCRFMLWPCFCFPTSTCFQPRHAHPDLHFADD